MRCTDRLTWFRPLLAALLLAGCVIGSATAGVVKNRPQAGVVSVDFDNVSRNGHHVDESEKVYSKDMVRTNSEGQANLILKLKHTDCTTSGAVTVAVPPPHSHFVLSLILGELDCSIAGRDCHLKLKAGAASISSCPNDPVVALIVRRARTVIKVIHGYAVVSGRGGRATAVLVGRRQQVVVPAAHAPQAAIPIVSPIVLTPKEKKAFAVILARLPPSRDMTPPTTTVSGPAKITAQLGAAFTFNAGEPRVVFACSLDGQPLRPCSSPVTYAALSTGTHTFAVTATDAAGNTAPALRYGWTIDTTPPVTTISTQQPATTSATTATFTFTSNEAGVTFTCQLDGAGFIPCSSPATYSGLGAGQHTFAVRATDAAGNVGAPRSISWTIDNRAPIVTIASGPKSTTNLTDASFAFNADKTSVSFSCQLDGAAPAPCSSPKTYVKLADGPHTFVAQATDALGNVGKTSYTWTIDSMPPIVRINSGPTNGTFATDATFAFTANETGVVFTCKLDNLAAALCTSPRTYSGLSSQATHTFQVTPTDLAGNVGRTATYTWTIQAQIK